MYPVTTCIVSSQSKKAKVRYLLSSCRFEPKNTIQRGTTQQPLARTCQLNCGEATVVWHADAPTIVSPLMQLTMMNSICLPVSICMCRPLSSFILLPRCLSNFWLTCMSIELKFHRRFCSVSRLLHSWFQSSMPSQPLRHYQLADNTRRGLLCSAVLTVLGGAYCARRCLLFSALLFSKWKFQSRYRIMFCRMCWTFCDVQKTRESLSGIQSWWKIIKKCLYNHFMMSVSCIGVYVMFFRTSISSSKSRSSR